MKLEERRTDLKSLRNWIPILSWLPSYQRTDLPGDLVAGLVIAALLVPQSMAYAALAGLSPQVGLYASVAPLVLYSIFGSSKFLAVGPAAVTSLMVASALAGINDPDRYFVASLTIAFMSGAILLMLGLFKFGFLTNFISHSVLSGFTSGAALLIIASQLQHFLGLHNPNGHSIFDTLLHTFYSYADINVTAVCMGLFCFTILIVFKRRMMSWLAAQGLPRPVASAISNTGPLWVVLFSTMIVAAASLDSTKSLDVVGVIPLGLPELSAPYFDVDEWRGLFSASLLIALIGFLESISIAKTLASKHRQKVDANQELIALGIANLGASFSSGYPVTGGFGRSAVNHASGANTQLSLIFAAAIILVIVSYASQWLYYLPKAAFAAILMVAAIGLIDLRIVVSSFRYNKPDSVVIVLTFVGVILMGIEMGLLMGIACSIAFFVYRTSKPHIAIVGRIGETEHFRNIHRHTVTTHPDIVVLRVDSSLYFTNIGYLEDYLRALVADQPEVKQVLLVCSGINFVDASALDGLSNLISELKTAGVAVHLSDVKGPVMDSLERSDFFEKLAPNRVFLSSHQALTELTASA